MRGQPILRAVVDKGGYPQLKLPEHDRVSAKAKRRQSSKQAKASRKRNR